MARIAGVDLPREKRIEIALQAGDVARALAEAGSLSKLFPNATSSAMLLARALSANGRNDEAIRLLESVSDPRPDLKELKEKLAAVAATSAADLEKSLAADPKNPVILGRLCSMLRMENPQKALVYCQRAAAADPQNLDHAVGFGAALVQAQRYGDAVEVLRRVVQVAPDHFTTRANLATALFQLKRYEEAKTEYLWLAEKKPDLAITYYFLALTHDQLTEYLDAMANYQQFLRLADPTANQIEIDKVKYRLPSLQKLIKEKKGRKS